MSDLFGNHIVGFPTRRLTCVHNAMYVFGLEIQRVVVFTLKFSEMSAWICLVLASFIVIAAGQAPPVCFANFFFFFRWNSVKTG